MPAIERVALTVAVVLGLAFPILESLRRGLAAWLTTPVTLLEDYVAGALLLVAAFAMLRRWPGRWVLMLGGCAYTTGMMSSSFWNQLEAQLSGVAWEPNQGLIVAVKALLWGLPLAMMILSVRMLLPATRSGSVKPG